MSKWLIILIALIIGVALLAAIIPLALPQTSISDVVNPIREQVQKNPQVVNQKISPDIEVLVENLDIPWEIVFLPSGEMLITERPGRVLKIGADRKVIEVANVRHVGEGGLLGMVLHPDFESNSYLYLYFTTEEGGGLANRVERYKFVNDSLTDRRVIVEGIEGASNHDGGRMAFGPDGMLYITTGDAQQTNLAQDRDSLNGKILRVRDDGSIPGDNPFGNAVYSWGHRNVQGIAWDESGRLWATEHGRSGVQSGLDELNLIGRGQNYGWPTIQGNEQRSGMRTPIINSGASETWAPSGATYFNGSVFFAGLRGETLYQAKLDGEKVSELKKHFQGEYGRLRAVVLGPDNFLYILTNNTDGRGNPKSGDDKLIKVNPKILQ